MVVDSPLLMLLVNGEESNVELAPAPCPHSDEIILLWIALSFSKGVRAGAGDWYKRNNQIKDIIILTRMVKNKLLTNLLERKSVFFYAFTGATETTRDVG